MSKLVKELTNLNKSDEYPFHMPGHKRNMLKSPLSSAYDIDITEIIGYDNLYEADGILKDALDRASRVFHSNKTWFLVNGSTVGLLTAITSAVNLGGKILISRNSHKAVYHACELRGLQIRYLYSEMTNQGEYPGIINPKEVEQALEKDPDIQAVVITSPTYEGLVSDIEKIAKLVHTRHIPLIVDEAHGAHFSFHERFPESAIRLGADIVIQSLHKTLPSFTQTAVMHLKGDLISPETITHFLGYYQTSSPSYVFMAGMDECIETIEQKGSTLWNDFFLYRDEFLDKCKSLHNINVISKERMDHADPCKIIISCKGTSITGKELQTELLEKYHLQFEMATDTYVLAIVTASDKKEGFDRLYNALKKIDQRVQQEPHNDGKIISIEQIINPDHPAIVRYTLSQAAEQQKELLDINLCDGKVAGVYVNLYPPGTPILVPGEIISKDIINLILQYEAHGLHVQGMLEGKLPVMK